MTLYSTAGCHLCEEAEAMLAQAGAAWETVDIAADPALLDSYGVRIPVLRTAGGAELGWPFDVAAVRAFLARQE